MPKKYGGAEVRCCVTGMMGADLHHIKTRGSGGTDDEWNLIPIARLLHQIWHARGTSYMASSYPKIKEWLEKNGWSYDPHRKKWVREQ